MNDNSEDIDKAVASIIRKELKNEDYDDSCWLKAFTKADGDEQKAKVLYIDLRTNDLKKQKKKEKLIEDSKTHSYMRCGRSFCVSTYKILSISKALIGVQKCQGCGNVLDYKVSEKDALDAIDNPRSKPINYSTKYKNTTKEETPSGKKGINFLNQNLLSKNKSISAFLDGDLDLVTAFWGYGVLGSNLLGFISGYLAIRISGIFMLVYLIGYAGAFLGIWKCANTYKKKMEEKNETTFWGIAAQVGVVLGAANVIKFVIEFLK